MAEAPTLAPRGRAAALRRERARAGRARVALVDEIFVYRQAHPPDPAGWAAQAGAGAAWDAGDRLRADRGADARRHRHRQTRSSTRATRTLLADRIPGARLELIEGAGHVLFWERPEEFAALVEEFLG